MNAENARRLAEREEIDRPKISENSVEVYRETHFPGSKAKHDAFIARGGVDIMGNDYIAKLDHNGFHEWFGTECDDTCPHPRGFRRPSKARALRRQRRWYLAWQTLSWLAVLFWACCLVMDVATALSGERVALYVVASFACVLCIYLEVGRIRRRAREWRER